MFIIYLLYSLTCRYSFPKMFFKIKNKSQNQCFNNKHKQQQKQNLTINRSNHNNKCGAQNIPTQTTGINTNRSQMKIACIAMQKINKYCYDKQLYASV